MFLDASFVVGILGLENDYKEQLARLETERGPFYFSAIVRYEATIAVARKNQASPGEPALLLDAEALFDDFMKKLPATEIEITSEIGKGAMLANRTYGKTVGHKAALNFGDCFSYAAAKVMGVGLLYKGNDFALTDLG